MLDLRAEPVIVEAPAIVGFGASLGAVLGAGVRTPDTEAQARSSQEVGRP